MTVSAQINLKEIERKAFRSTYQDGLWDIYFGLIVVGMSIFIYRPPEGYSPRNIILSTVIICVAGALFFAGKKFITVPRMGQVKFGAVRKKKNRTLAIVLGLFVLLQVGLVVLTATGWEAVGLLPGLSTATGQASLLLVSLIGSLIVGTSMIMIAYFTDFTRGYYIAMLMALAVFLMIYLNQPVYAILIGCLIIIPGVVLLVRFLKQYPLPAQAGANGS